MLSRFLPSEPGFLKIGLLFLLLTLMMMATSWQNLQYFPWWIEGDSDHVNLANMLIQRTSPEIFARDGIFADDRYFAFYTPSFLGIMELLLRFTGDYSTALILLQGIIALFYLPCAYIFFWQLTHKHLLSVSMAIVSLIGLQVSNDFWQMATLWHVLPRSFILPMILLVAALLLYQLRTPQRLGGWGLVGLGIGLCANLHPATGYTLAVVAGVTLCASQLRMGKLNLMSVGVLGIGAVLGVLPFILNLLQTTGTTTISDFSAALEAFIWRAGALLFPFATDRLAGLMLIHPFLINVFWLPLSFGLWFLGRLQPLQQYHWRWLPFAVWQMSLIWLFVDQLPLEWMLLLVGYWVWQARQKQPFSEVALVLLELSVGVMLASIVLPPVLLMLGTQFEIWSLLMFAAETPRNLRLLTLTVYGLIAVCLADISQQQVWLAGQRWLRRFMPPIRLAMYSLIMGSLFYFFARLTANPNFYFLPLLGALFGLLLGLQHIYRLRLLRFIPLLLLIISLVFLFLMWQSGFGTGFFYSGIGLCLLVGMFWHGIIRGRYSWFYGVAVLLGGGLILLFIRVTFQVIPNPIPTVVAAEWAQHNTPTNALFYYTGDVMRDSTMSQFRYYARRSVTNFYTKELGLVAYTRPDEFVTHFAQQRLIVSQNHTAAGILSMATQLNADYILALAQTPPLPLPSVYQNEAYIIYQVAP